LVPNGTALSLRINPGEPLVFDGIDVPPMQPPRVDSPATSGPKFVLDVATYSTDADYPGVLAEAEPVRNVRGQDCTIVRLYPYQYNPVTRRLSVYSDLVVELDFDGEIQPMPIRLKSTEYEAMLSRLAVNADAVLGVQRQRDKQSTAHSLYTLQMNTALDRIGNGQTVGCDYLIICDPAFYAAAETLVDWKRLSGFRTRAVTTDDTGITAAEIERYIDRSQSEWLPAPLYVLLLGDAEYIPCFYELEHASNDERPDGLRQGKVASDRYYGDTDEDGIADLFVGRLPVDTAAEAQMAVDRIINYERTPPEPAANGDFYTNFAAVAYFNDNYPRDGYADTRFVGTSEDVYQYLHGAGYSGRRIYYNDPGVEPTHWSAEYVFESDGGGRQPLPDYLLEPSFEWNAGTASITDAINSGAFLVSYRGHGARLMRSVPRGWSYLGGWIQPGFQEDDVAALTNGFLTPVVFSATCMTGWFDNETDDPQYEMYSDDSVVRKYESEPDSESLCENFILNPNGGAVGVIGATRVSYSGRNDRLVWGWMDAIWPDFVERYDGSYGSSDPIYRMGPVFEYGKQYMLTKYSYNWDYTKTTIDEFIWFGDPTMEIRTGNPELLTSADVTHPSAVNVGHVADITISVRKGLEPLVNARVTISCAAAPDDYWTRLTDKSGNVTFVGFATSRRGHYNIVVTAHNCIPYEGTIASESIGVGALTVERRVSAGEDDGYASDETSQDLGADFLIVGSSGNESPPYQISGMVFRNVNVPRSAEIISARLRVRSYSSQLTDIVLAKVEAEATDNAEALGGSRNVGSLLKTGASVNWDIDQPWVADTWYDSPDIYDVIREVVNRDGWSANNSLAILLGTRQDHGGYRCFSSFDREGADAPKLEITYAMDRTCIISGMVTFQGSGLPGVQMQDFPGVVLTDENGYYSTEVHYGWSGRVTPSMAGYVFAPVETVYDSVTSDQVRDYEAAVRTHTLSGYVLTSSGSGMSGVTVSANNDGGSATTDSAGYYRLLVPYGWSGRVAPSKPGYEFTVPYLEYVSVTDDRSNRDYTARTRTISGYVRTEDGLPISGAVMAASDGTVSSATDSTGYYSLAIPYGWSGRIIPSRIGFVFDPDYIDYMNAVDDLSNQDYTATARTLTISGHVWSFDGSGISGVTISADNGGGSHVTDQTGYYSLNVPYGWSGRIVPSRAGYMFSPADRNYTNVIYDEVDRNYARAKTYTISGYVRADDGSGIPGVTVSANNGGGLGVTDSTGYYSLIVLRGWLGRVTPAKAGYSFGPAYRDYTSITYNRTNRNYSGQP
ncbi:MAG: C25 family cysteine peptidase, partial [Planctomycetota bacterium]